MEREIPAVSIQPSQGTGNSCRALGFLKKIVIVVSWGAPLMLKLLAQISHFDCMAVLCVLRPKAESI